MTPICNGPLAILHSYRDIHLFLGYNLDHFVLGLEDFNWTAAIWLFIVTLLIAYVWKTM
jgi:hypothetical protein